MLLAALVLAHVVDADPHDRSNEEHWFPIAARVLLVDDEPDSTSEVAIIQGFVGAGPFVRGPFDHESGARSRRPRIARWIEGEDVVVEYSAPGGFESHRATVTLGPGGARATMMWSSDVFADSYPHGGGGVATVLVGKDRASLEFKLFGQVDGPGILVFVGRFSLDDVGLDRLRSLAEAPERPDAAPVRLRSTDGAAVEGGTAEGNVDAFGRRQGIWTLAFGDRQVITTWVDGVLDGPVSFVDDGRVSWAQSWRAGLPDGPSISHHRDGRRTESRFALGQRHGLQRTFAADGRLASSETWIWGVFPRTGLSAEVAEAWEAEAFAFASEVERLARVSD